MWNFLLRYKDYISTDLKEFPQLEKEQQQKDLIFWVTIKLLNEDWSANALINDLFFTSGQLRYNLALKAHMHAMQDSNLYHTFLLPPLLQKLFSPLISLTCHSTNMKLPASPYMIYFFLVWSFPDPSPAFSLKTICPTSKTSLFWSVALQTETFLIIVCQFYYSTYYFHSKKPMLNFEA